MFEMLAGYITTQMLAYFAGGSIAVVLAWVLEKIPNEKIKAFVGEGAYMSGVFVTLGLSKWKVTAGLWNKIIEPWVIDLIDNVITHGVKEFTRGLRSD